MIQMCLCPCCLEKLWPSPFVGRVYTRCPYCAEGVVLSTDGVSFETSRIRATRPVNGETTQCY